MPELSTYADNSVTARQLVRLVTGGGKVVQPGYDGVVGNGTTNDRAAIQAIIDANKRVVVTDGIYALGALEPLLGFGSLQLRDGSEFYSWPNATFKLNHNGSNGGGVITTAGASNIKIAGGIVDGNRATFPTGKANAIYVLDSDNVHIWLMQLKNVPGDSLAGLSAGDGVSIRGQSSVGTVGSTNVTVELCEIFNCVRQALGVYRGNAVTLRRNYIHDIVGTDPGGAIDLEPDSAGAEVNNVTCDNNTIKRCNYGIIVTALAQLCKVINNSISECVSRGLQLSDTQQNLVYGNTITRNSNSDNILPYVHAERTYYTQMYGNQYWDAATGGQVLMQLRECFYFSLDDETFLNASGKAFQALANFTLDSIGLKLTNSCFRNCSGGSSVIEIVPTTHLIKYLTLKGNKIFDERTGGSQATNGVLFTGMTGPEFLTSDIDQNMFQGVTNNYAGFPTGYGPGGQVPTADLPAAAAAMDGRTLLEYIDATHRAPVFYRGGKRFKGASIAES